jgi:adenosine/AMP kinase
MKHTIEVVKINKPENVNIIIGQTHFIKSVEDIYEALVSCVPNIKFGVAFCEASGACKVRAEGTDSALKDLAVQNALRVGCGHSFFVLLENAYPINVLNAIKNVGEVCSIICATANSLEVVVIQTELGRGIMGVVDGSAPCGVEDDADILWRKNLLRKIGYKL